MLGLSQTRCCSRHCRLRTTPLHHTCHSIQQPPIHPKSHQAETEPIPRSRIYHDGISHWPSYLPFNHSSLPGPNEDVPGQRWQTTRVHLSMSSSVSLLLKPQSYDRGKRRKHRGNKGHCGSQNGGVVVPPEAGVDAMESDEVGCDIKLWEECAREWGSGKVRRGDVVVLQGQCVRESILRVGESNSRTALIETSRRSVQACYSTREGSSCPLINHISHSLCRRVI